ncbi:MAG: DUF1648 domain-containing protein [Kiritimatiellae bacterium]|nr:DUF1648 domain-containing protein [Kiritimatiellia bacterium]
MNSRTFPIALFLLLCVACLAHGLYYYPRLPAEVAHHFGASGQPDAWGSKEHFLVVYLVTVAVMAATFLGLGLAMPKIPNSAINLPNKEYWLAPERRRQTLDYMLPRLLWLGSLTMVLLLDIFHQSFQVHLGKATSLPHVWYSMVAYLIATAVWCIAVYRRFGKRESQLEKRSEL